MKCAYCGKSTDWDTSYGTPKYLVCGCCFEDTVQKVMKDSNKKYADASAIVLNGIIRKGS